MAETQSRELDEYQLVAVRDAIAGVKLYLIRLASKEVWSTTSDPVSQGCLCLRSENKKLMRSKLIEKAGLS